MVSAEPKSSAVIMIRRQAMVTISRPFKGSWFYEWQVGPVVLQWLHSTSLNPIATKGITWDKLHIWLDLMWKMH